MCSANDRRRYIVTSFLFGWAHTQNDPCHYGITVGICLGCYYRVMTSSNRNIFRVTALCEGNPPFSGGFPSQRPVTQSFGVFFDLRLNKRLSKQLRRWWFEMQLHSLWRYCNGKKMTPWLYMDNNSLTLLIAKLDIYSWILSIHLVL